MSMKWMKRLVMILCLMVVTVGCQGSKEKEIDYENSKLVVDCVGREVYIPKDPQRVTCTFSVAGHIMVMLGEGDKIVATSNGIHRDKLVVHLQPSIEETSIVSRSGAVNFEEMLELKTDLAIISYDHYADASLKKQYERYNIPYVVVDFNSIEEQQYLVTMLGEVFDQQEEAAVYNEFYNDMIALADDVVADIPVEDRIRLYHSINEANCTVAEGTLPAQWMEVAGGIDVSKEGDLDKDGNKYYTTLEEILKWNPQEILVNVSGVGDYILENEQWAHMDAVINKKVHQMPIGMSRWGHTTSIETPLAIAWTVQQLYPDTREVIDIRAIAKGFYKELFEFDIEDEVLDQILAGQDMRLSKNLEE